MKKISLFILVAWLPGCLVYGSNKSDYQREWQLGNSAAWSEHSRVEKNIERDKISDLMCYATRGCLEEKALHSKQHELGKKDVYGQTALMHAAESNNVSAVQLLKKHELKMQDNKGRTAFMHAIENYSKECAELLKEEQDIRDNDGSTALMIACLYRNLHGVELLAGKQGGLQDNYGYTALMHAVASRVIEKAYVLPIYALFSEYGMQDKEGNTALMWLVRSCRNYSSPQVFQNFETLMKTKEVGMRNKKGETALMAAADGHAPVEFIEELAKKELGMRDMSGKTALQHADRAEYWKGMKPLIEELRIFSKEELNKFHGYGADDVMNMKRNLQRQMAHEDRLRKIEVKKAEQLKKERAAEIYKSFKGGLEKSDLAPDPLK